MFLGVYVYVLFYGGGERFTLMMPSLWWCHYGEVLFLMVTFATDIAEVAAAYYLSRTLMAPL